MCLRTFANLMHSYATKASDDSHEKLLVWVVFEMTTTPRDLVRMRRNIPTTTNPCEEDQIFQIHILRLVLWSIRYEWLGHQQLQKTFNSYNC